MTLKNLLYLVCGSPKYNKEELENTWHGKLVIKQKALALPLVLTSLLLISESFLFGVKYISGVEDRRPVTLRFIDEVVNCFDYKSIQEDYNRVEKDWPY